MFTPYVLLALGLTVIGLLISYRTRHLFNDFEHNHPMDVIILLRFIFLTLVGVLFYTLTLEQAIAWIIVYAIVTFFVNGSWERCRNEDEW